MVPASFYAGPRPSLGSRVLNRIGREFESRQSVVPKALLRKAASANITHALRRGVRAGAVWRPVIEAAFEEQLVIEVDPHKIVGWLGQFVRVDRQPCFDAKPWFVLSGDWDIRPLPFDQPPTYCRMADIVSYHQSASYREIIDQQNSGTLPKRLVKAMAQVGSIESYYERYRELAEIMRKDRAIPNFGPNDQDRHVGLAIGRYGQMLQFQKGHHRMALAHLLGCRRMLARVLAVHLYWAREVLDTPGLRLEQAIARGVAELGS